MARYTIAGVRWTAQGRTGAAARLARLAAGLLLLMVGLAAPAGAAPGVKCGPVTFPVALAPGAPAAYHVAGELCSPLPPQGRTIQVLLPGATYNHTYWDFPLQPAQYSYVAAATAAGYTTLALDRIGTGASDHPPADQVTLAADAYTVHQVLQFVRAGQQLGGRPGRVLLVGHSLGSAVALTDAAEYPSDADGLLLSGFSLALTPQIQQMVETGASPLCQPAPPAPAGYLTTCDASARAAMFYSAADADPAVINEDEATKDVVSGQEFGDMLQFFLGPGAQQAAAALRTPALDALGQDDAIFASTEIVGTPYVLTGAGHDLNLHRNAPDWFAAAQAWADATVGACPAGCPPR